MCGLPVFPPKPKPASQALTRRASASDEEAGAKRSESALTAFPASSQFTPAERGSPFVKAGESHSDHD